LKIVITTFTYSPNKDGVSEATRSIAEGLASKGHEVIVATGFHKDRKEGKHNGIEVVSFKISNQGVWKVPNGPEAERFSRFVLSRNPDILINQCWDAWPAVLSQKIFNQLSCKKIHVSHGYSQHIWTPYFKPLFGLGQLLKGLFWTFFKFPGVANSYDAIVFLSECGGFGRFLDQTICRSIKHPCLHTIPNSVEDNKYTNIADGFRTKYNIGDGLMVLCVANYSDRKNQKLAVRAFRKSNIPGSTLVFIGSEFNKYSEKVMKKDQSLASKSLCRTIFLEGISREQTQEAFACCDIFLLTANQETQPIVIIEAMAAGKPWISSPTGCIPDMEGGILAKGCDKISEALTDLSKNSQARIRLGRQGRDAVLEKYERRKVAESWIDLISSHSHAR
jgi:glycosyltransferase involved in cell wall biosynthesis